ncbi:hypothetical protein ACFRFN_40110 [Streptomyces mirabilis]|uniref:ISAzo13-like element transposase-related protein n=1 Tax=Streptomyces mirabilis TaxID=68239 RepID=UPI0036A5E544
MAAKFEAILPHLDERQRRLLIGAEAQSLGHGGIRTVARAAGVREATVSAGMRELDSGEAPLGRIRRPGAGRKRVVERNPAIREALLTLVEPDIRGDPMSPLRWTTKSTRKLAEHLTRQGHRISADTVGDPVHPVPGRKTAPGPAPDPRHADTRNARPHNGTATRPNNPRGNPSLTVIEIRAPRVPENWRATPAEARPFLANPVSSTTSTPAPPGLAPTPASARPATT